MRKKILSVILAASMMLALTPNTVMAARMSGETLQSLQTTEKEVTADSSSNMEGLGTEASPYRIKTAEQLHSFADMVNGVGGEPNTGLYAVLTCSIDLSGICGADLGSWTPIGTNTNPYTGIFDGGSFAITGLYYHKSNSSYVGLFGSNAGIIKNLEVAGTDVSAGSYTGGVCGYNNGTITGCYNATPVKGAKYTGGICGYNDVAGTVNICYNTGAVSGSKYVGGICGYNKNVANNCYNMGAINGDNTSIGGICGYNRALVSNCFNTGTVNGGGKKYIGSVCGYNHSQSSFLNCYYLITGEEKGNYGVGMTQEQFASGEVCWLLNEGKSEKVVWHQTCGAGFPTFGGKIVYQVRRPKAGGSADEMIVAYTNETERKQASNNNSTEDNDSDKTSDENTNGHVYQEPEWEWKEYSFAKAVFTCKDCGEKLSLEASVSKKITEATCAKEGKTVYTASVNRDGKTYTDKKTEKLEKSDHKTIVSEQKREATCEKVGIKEACWRCSDCGKYFKEQEGKTEIPREEVEIPAKGHLYGNAAWNWNMENNPPVATASFTCGHGCGTIEKREGTVSSETDATCTTAGNTVYTAVVTFNGKTYEDKKTVSGQPTPHSYGEPEWKWADDFSTASATFTCKVCSHSETKSTTPTPERKEPTCIAEGEVKYTAVVPFGGREYSDQKTDSLPLGNHNFGKPEWTWSSDYKEAAATFICAVCGEEVSKQATVTEEVPTGLSCGTPGEAKYTASVTIEKNTYYDVKTKKILIDHTMKHFPKVPAKCETGGNEEYWVCEGCNKFFSDEAGEEAISGIPVISATGHKLEHVTDNIYQCTVCDGRFTVSPDGTTRMYSVEEDAVIQQDETENSEEKPEDTETQPADEQDGEAGQSEPEDQTGETNQSEPEDQTEQDMQSEPDGQNGQDEDESNNDDVPDVPENAARYGLIYPEGEEPDPVETDAWEESAVNLRAESARNGAAQTVQAQQQQGYPLWVSITVLAVLAGMIMFFILRRKDNR